MNSVTVKMEAMSQVNALVSLFIQFYVRHMNPGQELPRVETEECSALTKGIGASLFLHLELTMGSAVSLRIRLFCLTKTASAPCFLDCCDGTDEANGVCGNDCLIAGAEAKREALRAIEQHEKVLLFEIAKLPGSSFVISGSGLQVGLGGERKGC